MTAPRPLAVGDIYDVYCGAPLATGGYVLAALGLGWRRIAVYRAGPRWLGLIDTASLRAANVARAEFAICKPAFVVADPSLAAKVLERRRRQLARAGAPIACGKRKRPTRRRIQQIAKAFRP